MRRPRRKFLLLAASAAAACVTSRLVRAETYPARPVRIVIGLPPGSTSDIIARLTAEWLSRRLGQPFVVENRTGAGTNIGTEFVVRSPPDGHTLLFIVAANAINVTFYSKLNFDFVRDIAPVARITGTPFVMEVNPAFPAKTVPELIAYAKANPGKIAMASSGIGTFPHMAGELFKTMTGVNIVHVPYRGTPLAMNDLLGGQVQVMFDPALSSMELIKAGKLRPLAVTTATRLEVLPDVPAMGEFVPGYEANGWVGIGAPKNTPAEIINKLNTEINAGLTDPTMKIKLADLGGDARPGTPNDFAKLIADETAKWAKVVRAANIKAD